MQVTADTLFHFTTSLKNLENILSKKFQLTYCHEKYLLDYETHDFYYPMVSFCDIPLSLAKDQIENYGSYAIGMTKEWGIKNNLNPVVYVEKDSLLAKDIQSTLDNIIKLSNPITKLIKKSATTTSNIVSKTIEKIKILLDNKNPDNKTLILNELKDALENVKNNASSNVYYKELVDNLGETANYNSNLFRYIKNYQGILIRNDKTYDEYRFYNEREWRYVPSLNDNRLKKSLSQDEFNEYRGLHKNKPFIENINLLFNGNDIRYLIVKSNKDIPKLIKTIKSIDNLTKNPNDSDILTTKIMTVSQLNNDF